MQFLIPHVKPEATAEFYKGIKKFLPDNFAGRLSARRIESIHFRDLGKDCEAKVGAVCPVNGEVVFAILYEPARRLYHVCTWNRGFRQGYSILVGEHEVPWITDFEEYLTVKSSAAPFP